MDIVVSHGLDFPPITETAQKLPEPGRIEQDDIDEKQCRQWQKKNKEIHRQYAETDEDTMACIHILPLPRADTNENRLL